MQPETRAQETSRSVVRAVGDLAGRTCDQCATGTHKAEATGNTGTQTMRTQHKRKRVPKNGERSEDQRANGAFSGVFSTSRIRPKYAMVRARSFGAATLRASDRTNG